MPAPSCMQSRGDDGFQRPYWRVRVSAGVAFPTPRPASSQVRHRGILGHACDSQQDGGVADHRRPFTPGGRGGGSGTQHAKQDDPFRPAASTTRNNPIIGSLPTTFLN